MLLEDAWPRELRPPYLQKKSGIGQMTFNDLMSLKEQIGKEEGNRNLGQEIFRQDGVPKKIKHKAQTDNGRSKLHLARYHRLPLVHPKEYFKDIPTKRDVIVRNFPMEHYGVSGQVSETAIGRLHNRTVVQTFDAFGKSTHKPAKPGTAAGKYSDLNQLQEGMQNYGAVMHAIWPYDYTSFVMGRIMVDSNWCEIALPDEKKRSEIVIEFFNGVLMDNCGKAVHKEYPVVHEQVQTQTMNLKVFIILIFFELTQIRSIVDLKKIFF